jgi:hypothetical protein
MLHSDLYAYLVGTSEIAELFPGGIHHESLPQDVETWPALSFFQVSRNEIFDDWEAPDDVKLDEVQYQFDIVSPDSQSTLAAADTFLSIFRNFRGTMSTTRVQHIRLGNESHLEERRGDKLRRRVSMDFAIIF